MRFPTAVVAVPLSVLAFAGVTACGGGDDKKDDTAATTTAATTTAAPSKAITSNAANASTTLTIGSKNFTEQKVLGEIYAQAFAAAGFKVKKELNLGDEKTALKALKSGQISAYPEYTGTALLSFFDVPTSKLPKTAVEAYAEVGKDFAKEGIAALPATPFTSSNEVAITQATQKKLGGITDIAQLKDKASTLTLYGTPECRQREDCLLGLEKVYGLKFKKFVPVDPSLRHTVLEKGQADVSIVFTTDPENERDKLVLLKDTKGMFPPYNSTLLMKQSTLSKAGAQQISTLVGNVNAGLNAQTMQELNARVDLDKETPAQAAGEYLKDSGYVTGS